MSNDDDDFSLIDIGNSEGRNNDRKKKSDNEDCILHASNFDKRKSYPQLRCHVLQNK